MSGASKSEADWRRSVIRPALSCPPGSRARSEAIRLIAARFHPHPKGRERRVSASTARRWVADYEADGLAGLCRKARADRGVEKWAISRLWDEAVSLDDAARQRTRDQLVFHVKRLYRSGIASRRQAQHLATEKLIKLTRAAGCELPEKTAHTICQVPLRLIRKQRHFRAVAIRDKDAKQYADKMRPRARRTREGMAPMEIVCADVHHLDVMLERPDGSRYTPKMIAFLDLKTNRLFCRLLFPEPGRMVRQADVNEAFVAMTQDPDWGVPGRLLLDHGAEFEALAAVGDAMKLAQRVRGSSLTVEYLGDDPALAGQIESLRSDARSAISKARPYNAAAKPIEGIFGNLERSIFSHLPGWVGGDRMNRRVQGRP